MTSQEGLVVAVPHDDAPTLQQLADGYLDDYQLHEFRSLRPSTGPTAIVRTGRTPWQDPELAVKQLVDVPLRALSPGVNEPFTAVTCTEGLAESLARMADGTVMSPAHAFHHHCSTSYIVSGRAT